MYCVSFLLESGQKVSGDISGVVVKILVAEKWLGVLEADDAWTPAREPDADARRATL